MSYYDYYPPYVSVAQRKAKAQKKLKQLKKKNPSIRPVIVEGQALAKTWWGKAWNKNLEKYADYSNRIGRGRSYVRQGSVLDLQIAPKRITALVAGSGSKPYTVHIHIKEIQKAIWMRIRHKCEGKLESLQKLLAGKFPKELQEIFTVKREGLFPSPKEIKFDCSCPDWADMCKHVAAVLYGIGTRLDEDPSLFFKLRNVKIEDLISQAVSTKTSKLLNQAKKKSQKALDDTDLSDLFGIDLETTTKSKTGVKSNPKLPKPVVAKPKIKSVLKKSQKPNKNTSKPKKRPPLILVKEAILKAKKGISALDLELKTGIPRKQIYALVQKLKQDQIIKSKSRGVYIKM